jgi:hypothetical protein
MPLTAWKYTNTETKRQKKPVQTRKNIQFKLEKISSSSNWIFKTGNYKNEVPIDRGITSVSFRLFVR